MGLNMYLYQLVSYIALSMLFVINVKAVPTAEEMCTQDVSLCKRRPNIKGMNIMKTMYAIKTMKIMNAKTEINGNFGLTFSNNFPTNNRVTKNLKNFLTIFISFCCYFLGIIT